MEIDKMYTECTVELYDLFKPVLFTFLQGTPHKPRITMRFLQQQKVTLHP